MSSIMVFIVKLHRATSVFCCAFHKLAKISKIILDNGTM